MADKRVVATVYGCLGAVLQVIRGLRSILRKRLMLGGVLVHRRPDSMPSPSLAIADG